jgi:DNA modification methylase
VGETERAVTARYIVGDTRAVTATLPDGSVDFLMTSPPFLALRSYLPGDHPDKALEIGSEPTPAAFIDVLLDLTAEWRRVLAPHGSIVVELGDTYAGSGGGGGDYLDGGWREGQTQFAGSAASMRESNAAHWRQKAQAKNAWPRTKSLTGIPERYRLALIDGYTGMKGSRYRDESPAGRWQVRNVIRWVRPNPPVGALGKKWRPATSELVVACPDDDRRYWDDVATRTEHGTNATRYDRRDRANQPPVPGRGDSGLPTAGPLHPAGAPLLDHWLITPKGYEGAHYAVYPPELCVAPIEAMCPRRVCVTCGRPSERETAKSERYAEIRARVGDMLTHKTGTNDRSTGRHGDSRAAQLGALTASEYETTGWTSCSCPGTDGIRLDGFHTGTGWRPGIVLDCFAGTGTTLAVATGHGRDAIGIDLDARNADLALQRVGPLLLTVEHHADREGAA